MDIGHTWYEETPHSKPKKAEPQQKLLEFPAIVLSNKVLIIIIVSIITVFAGVLFVHQPGANHARGGGGGGGRGGGGGGGGGRGGGGGGGGGAAAAAAAAALL